MNRKRLLVYAFAAFAGLPLMAQAEKVLLSKDLVGLPIDIMILDGGDSTSGAGEQVMKLTNNGPDTVKCNLIPGPAEGGDKSPTAMIEPGKMATLRVPGKYTDTPLEATVKCRKS